MSDLEKERRKSGIFYSTAYVVHTTAKEIWRRWLDENGRDMYRKYKKHVQSVSNYFDS